MRFPAFLALPLLLMLAQPGLAQTGTAAAAKAPVTLDELFDKLQETQNPIEAKQLERKIWEAWGKSDSDTLEALMQGGVTVMEKGDYKRAVDIFSTVIELKPDFSWPCRHWQTMMRMLSPPN